MAYRKSLLDLKNAVRDLLDESSASFWSEVQLHRYINRAKDRVWMRVRALNEDYFTVTRTSDDGTLTILGDTYTSSNFAIAAGTRDYTLPPDFSEMKLIECITDQYATTRFVYRDMSHPDMRGALEHTASEEPIQFYFDIVGERTLRVAPLSDRALALRITYVQHIPDMESASATSEYLTMPHPLYLAVVEYAVAGALKQDRNPDAGAYEAGGDKIIAEMMGAHHRQTQDSEAAIAYGYDYTGVA